MELQRASNSKNGVLNRCGCAWGLSKRDEWGLSKRGEGVYQRGVNGVYLKKGKYLRRGTELMCMSETRIPKRVPRDKST